MLDLLIVRNYFKNTSNKKREIINSEYSDDVKKTDNSVKNAFFFLYK